MKFNNTQVFNFDGAFRGMRNPKNSWSKSDSYFGLLNNFDIFQDKIEEILPKWLKYYEDKSKDFESNFTKTYDKNYLFSWLYKNGIVQLGDGNTMSVALIGPNDMKLAKQLIQSGSEHRKFLRQIFVSVDITGPLYWWKELDTYKVGTVANSTSTMHKLASTPITIDCFETKDYDPSLKIETRNNTEIQQIIGPYNGAYTFIDFLESLRLKYLETKNKRYWKELIRWLPESWLQTRTVTMSYENLLAMCGKGQRRFHKLSEWSFDFINWARELPYAQELIFYDEVE